MGNIMKMDILTIPDKKEETYAEITKWVVSAKPDKNGAHKIVFKKKTPLKILKSFERNYNLMPYKVNRQFEIEE